MSVFTLAMQKSEGFFSVLSSKVPSFGVTSFIPTTCSSTGGIVAPVPCAPTWDVIRRTSR